MLRTIFSLKLLLSFRLVQLSSFYVNSLGRTDRSDQNHAAGTLRVGLSCNQNLNISGKKLFSQKKLEWKGSLKRWKGCLECGWTLCFWSYAIEFVRSSQNIQWLFEDFVKILMDQLLCSQTYSKISRYVHRWKWKIPSIRNQSECEVVCDFFEIIPKLLFPNCGSSFRTIDPMKSQYILLR